MWGFMVMILVGAGQCQYIGQSYEPILPVFIRGIFNGVQQDSTKSNVNQQSQSVETTINDAVAVDIVHKTTDKINEVATKKVINDDLNKTNSTPLESNLSITTPRSSIDTSHPKPLGRNQNNFTMAHHGQKVEHEIYSSMWFC